ncbi:DeoR/GlpR family DNA-binding transcription regulator [Serinicoccus kebangsaanensis]|uniref:DeoR/GlpR family DNA-binding transcription regulator n=1 Tax=Serinicoccus kebangsaanensis TaxID=2602069 RepID=UPI00178C2D30|nr:DeoR/GlpR family DNA-binding transcription regulator [Serinicoccus kebangsaanensis]
MPPAHARRTRILDIVNAQGFARVTELAQQMQVTEVTVRSDLTHLARSGAVRRVHGGAVPGRRSVADEAGYEASLLRAADEKERIGRVAVGLLSPGAAVMIDAGTTTTAMVRALVARDDLEGVVVITNSLTIALELEPTIPRHTVVISGGTLRPRQHSLVDPLGDAVIGRIRADVGVIGCNGVDVEAGITNSSMTEAAVKARMLEASHRRVVLADSDKIGRVQLTQVAPLAGVDTLITTRQAPASVVADIEACGIEVIKA